MPMMKCPNVSDIAMQNRPILRVALKTYESIVKIKFYK